MRLLALVPARGGSKRVPGKNIRPLAGRPLVAWTLDAARGLPYVTDVLVSTDDPSIAEVCRHEGALAPWLRPAALSADETGMVDVAVHALDWYERAQGPVDGLLLLQPTTPFRTRQTLSRGIDMFERDREARVIGVSPASSHPAWCFTIEGGALRPVLPEAGLQTRSQDLEPAFHVNGSFYLLSPHRLRTDRSFYGGRMLPLIAGTPEEALDIDTEWDWRMAEAAATAGRKTILS